MGRQAFAKQRPTTGNMSNLQTSVAATYKLEINHIAMQLGLLEGFPERTDIFAAL